MTDKEKIKAEIERLKERYVAFHRRDGIDWPLDNYGKMRAYNEIEEFINSLPEEPKIEESGIYNALAKFIGSFSKRDFDIAKHFYGLGHTEEPVSEDLEEAAIMHYKDVMEYEVKTGLKPAYMTSFKAGAQWQKQKEINEIRTEIKRRYEHHLGCMEGSRDDTYPEISHAHHCAIKTELFEILCFLDVLEGNKKI